MGTHTDFTQTIGMSASGSVQCFGKKKNSIAVAHCKTGRGVLKVNGRPLSVMEPEILREKLMEPVKLLGQDKFNDLDIRVRVSGGGKVAQGSPRPLPEVLPLSCSGCTSCWRWHISWAWCHVTGSQADIWVDGGSIVNKSV